MKGCVFMKTKADTIARTTVFFVSLINQILIWLGKEVLPWSENEIYTGVSSAVFVAVSIVCWWKNNSFTKPAIEADEYLEVIRGEK